MYIHVHAIATSKKTRDHEFEGEQGWYTPWEGLEGRKEERNAVIKL